MVPLYFFLVLLPTFFNAFACSVLTPFGRGKAQQIKKKNWQTTKKKRTTNHIVFLFFFVFSFH